MDGEPTGSDGSMVSSCCVGNTQHLTSLCYKHPTGAVCVFLSIRVKDGAPLTVNQVRMVPLSSAPLKAHPGPLRCALAVMLTF